MARKKAVEQYLSLTIRVEDFSGELSAGINYEATDHRDRHEKTHVYRFGSTIRFQGSCIYPTEGDSYDITVHSAEPGSKLIDAQLHDFHLRDEGGAPRYSRQRGIEVPLYQIPAGLGLLEKVRGKARWHGWIWVPEEIASQTLTLAASGKQLFVEILECKVGRKRWINHLTVQTTDPL